MPSTTSLVRILTLLRCCVLPLWSQYICYLYKTTHRVASHGKIMLSCSLHICQSGWICFVNTAVVDQGVKAKIVGFWNKIQHHVVNVVSTCHTVHHLMENVKPTPAGGHSRSGVARTEWLRTTTQSNGTSFTFLIRTHGAKKGVSRRKTTRANGNDTFDWGRATK